MNILAHKKTLAACGAALLLACGAAARMIYHDPH
mgnify:FL=1